MWKGAAYVVSNFTGLQTGSGDQQPIPAGQRNTGRDHFDRRLNGGIKLKAGKLELLEELWLNICVICSMIGLTAVILDWYNPYMNFSGYIRFTQIILYVGVIAGAFFRKIFYLKNIKENP